MEPTQTTVEAAAAATTASASPAPPCYVVAGSSKNGASDHAKLAGFVSFLEARGVPAKSVPYETIADAERAAHPAKIDATGAVIVAHSFGASKINTLFENVRLARRLILLEPFHVAKYVELDVDKKISSAERDEFKYTNEEFATSALEIDFPPDTVLMLAGKTDFNDIKLLLRAFDGDAAERVGDAQESKVPRFEPTLKNYRAPFDLAHESLHPWATAIAKLSCSSVCVFPMARHSFGLDLVGNTSDDKKEIVAANQPIWECIVVEAM